MVDNLFLLTTFLLHLSILDPTQAKPSSHSERAVLPNTLWPKRVYCAYNENHIGCRFQQGTDAGIIGHRSANGPGIFGKECGDVIYAGLTEKDMMDILDMHNLKRSEVAAGVYSHLPHAANMARMVWDPQVAGLAQLYANQCTQEYVRGIESLLPDGDPIRNYQLKYVASPDINEQDENAVLTPQHAMNFALAVESWFAEIEKFVHDDVHRYIPDLRTLHFTQLIWANTWAVGCGFIRYRTRSAPIVDAKFIGDANVTALLEHDSWWVNEELVCHYAPGGNLAGQPIYAAGKPCSACPSVMPVCRDKLCSLK